MTLEKKRKVVEAIRAYMDAKGLSQNKMAPICEMSPSHVSYVMREDFWSQVGDEKWQQLAAQFLPSTWAVYPTVVLRTIHRVCQNAQAKATAQMVSEYTGAGKTWALREYASKTADAYLIECDTVMRPKEFIREIQRSMGFNIEGTPREMILAVTKELLGVQNPLLIFDEADKLSDAHLMLMKLLFDKLENRCGFVLCGTEVLKNKIYKFAMKDKLGYREFRRRFGNLRSVRKFNPKDKAIGNDILAICKDQGIEKPDQVRYILDHCDNYGTLRTLIQDLQYKNAIPEPTSKLEAAEAA